MLRGSPQEQINAIRDYLFRMVGSLDEAIAGRLKERCGRFLINVTPEPGKNFRFRGEG